MEQPLSLYLELEPGQTADLEVVARASLAFAATIKEAAFLVDPSLEVSIGFTSGTVGSLSLNTAIKVIRKAVPKDRAALVAIATGVAIFFGHEVTSYVVGKGFDHILGADTLSDADIARIAVEVDRLQRDRVAQKHVREVYRELTKDKAVTAVGVTPQAGQKPTPMVPRTEFEERSNEAISTSTTPQRRSRDKRERVTLIAPVLLPRERSWRLWMANIGEFGATMRDEKFLDDLSKGRLKIQLQAGVQMDVVMTTIEENAGVVWEVRERSIKTVLKMRKPTASATADLFSALDKGRGNNQ
jgi:hypothetical protein